MADNDQEAGDGGLSARLAARIAAGLDTIFGPVRSADIFQTLEKTEDRVVLGVGSIERAGGFGFGAGEGIDSAGQTSTGGGGGGGGWGQARPVAIVEVKESGVTVWPVVDYTKLGLVAVGVLAAIWKARR